MYFLIVTFVHPAEPVEIFSNVLHHSTEVKGIGHGETTCSQINALGGSFSLVSGRQKYTDIL